MYLYRGFKTQEELDHAYDVEKSVPDFLDYALNYVTQSRHARNSLRSRLDVAFGPTRDEHLDLFLCDDANAPILIFIHGGYWKFLSSKEFSFIAKGPVACGYHVAVTNYSLCPKVSIDEITRQTRAAIAWVFRNAASFGGDPNRIQLVGHSAGAHQVAMALLTDWPGEYGLPAGLIRRAVAISGLYDLRPFPYSFVQPALQLDWGQVQRNSPLFHLPETSPPLVISYGSEEPAEFIRQSNDFLQAWKGRGLAGELLVQEGRNHFDAIYGLADPQSALCRLLSGPTAIPRM
jgi:arylformamidase